MEMILLKESRWFLNQGMLPKKQKKSLPMMAD